MVHFLLLCPNPWPRREAACPAPPLQRRHVSGVKILRFPLPPGEFLQHTVRMLAGFCLPGVVYSQHSLQIYLPATRFLHLREVPGGNTASHLVQFVGRVLDVARTAMGKLLPACASSPTQLGQPSWYRPGTQLRRSVCDTALHSSGGTAATAAASAGPIHSQSP